MVSTNSQTGWWRIWTLIIQITVNDRNSPEWVLGPYVQGNAQFSLNVVKGTVNQGKPCECPTLSGEVISDLNPLLSDSVGVFLGRDTSWDMDIVQHRNLVLYRIIIPCKLNVFFIGGKSTVIDGLYCPLPWNKCVWSNNLYLLWWERKGQLDDRQCAQCQKGWACDSSSEVRQASTLLLICDIRVSFVFLFLLDIIQRFGT